MTIPRGSKGENERMKMYEVGNECMETKRCQKKGNSDQEKKVRMMVLRKKADQTLSKKIMKQRKVENTNKGHSLKYKEKQ